MGGGDILECNLWGVQFTRVEMVGAATIPYRLKWKKHVIVGPGAGESLRITVVLLLSGSTHL